MCQRGRESPAPSPLASIQSLENKITGRIFREQFGQMLNLSCQQVLLNKRDALKTPLTQFRPMDLNLWGSGISTETW